MSSELSEWYFRPRSFELRRDGRIYILFGVRIYKRFVPTSGDIITRLRGIDRLKIVESGGRRQALENYEKQTRKWEWRHLISAILLQSWAVGAEVAFGNHNFLISTVINLLVNVYPIMVQRFNRARITNILSAMR